MTLKQFLKEWRVIRRPSRLNFWDQKCRRVRVNCGELYCCPITAVAYRKGVAFQTSEVVRAAMVLGLSPHVAARIVRAADGHVASKLYNELVRW